MLGSFDDIRVGTTISLGVQKIDETQITLFCGAYAPTWDHERGAPDAMVYALWSRMMMDAIGRWPHYIKNLGQDALRWFRNPPAGELLRGRMTILAKEAVGEDKGIIIAQQDVLDEDGRLVFSMLTRDSFNRKEDVTAG